MLDFFGGSGTLGAVADATERHFVLIDSNPEAITVMKSRLAGAPAQLGSRGTDFIDWVPGEDSTGVV